MIAHSLRRLAIALAGTATIALAAPAAAQGDLLVAPTRIIMNGNGNAEVVLSNIGSQTATYRIGVELRRMKPSGDLDDVTEAEANATEQAALAMLRYAPRRITLMPGQPQAIRLSARLAPEVPDGEYRVHMSFRAVPNVEAPSSAPDPAAAAGQLAIKLTPIYGITIPVFVRKGRLEAGAAMSNPRLVKNGPYPAIELDMTRTGQRSVYGEIIGKRGGEQVFLSKGVAIYPEVGGRKVTIPLRPEQLAKLSGPIRIEFREMPENGGQLISELTTALQ